MASASEFDSEALAYLGCCKGGLQQSLIGDGAAGDASIEQGTADRRAAGRVLRAVHAGAGNFARGVQVRDHGAVGFHDARRRPSPDRRT